MPIFNPPLKFPEAELPVSEVISVASFAKEVNDGLAVKIIESNPARKGLTIINLHDGIVYLDVSNNITSTSYMFALEAGSFYEMPLPIHHSSMWAITMLGTATLQIREFYRASND